MVRDRDYKGCGIGIKQGSTCIDNIVLEASQYRELIRLYLSTLKTSTN